MRKPVTTDVSVLQGWPKKKGGKASSAEVAEALGITVFQITARLKGMETRGFVARDNGTWLRTEKGLAEAKSPSPSVVKAPTRQLNSLGFATGAPDDSKVPLLHIKREDWAPSEFAFEEAKGRLPLVKRRLAELKEQGDSEQNRHGIMALRTELDHCRAVLRKPRDARWFHRRVKLGESHTLEAYVAPDGREYVKAAAFEVADVRLAMSEGFEPVRLRLYTTSAVAKKADRAQKEQEGREAAKLERRQRAKETEALVPADDTGDGWGRLTKKERQDEKFRARAESAFWNLPEERRDKIRKSGKYESYEEWYRRTLQRSKKRTG